MEATTTPLAREPEPTEEDRVTPLELFFDLVFVFAFTQVTGLMAAHTTWEGLGQGMLVLAVVWWAWAGYTWLTNALHSDDGIARVALLSAMGAMLIAALAVPQAFGEDSVVFGIAYLAVRVIHLAVYTYGVDEVEVGRRDPLARARAAGRAGADRDRRLPRRRRRGRAVDRRDRDRLRHPLRAGRRGLPRVSRPTSTSASA